MSSDFLGGLPGGLRRRLRRVRGGAPVRSPTVRALASFARHSACGLARLGFAAGIDFDRLLAGTSVKAPFGQSPFAFHRGLLFERLLRADGYARTWALLQQELHLPAGQTRAVNLREGFPASLDGMELRARETRRLLKQVVEGDADAPNLIDGAVLSATVGGVQARFEADGIAARTGGLLHLAEVKSFPRVDGRVDPEQLGAALDQVAVYVLLARREVEQLGGDPGRISSRALLITPVNVGLRPALSALEVGPRVARVGEVLAGVPGVADVINALPTGLSFGPVADAAISEPQRLESLRVIAEETGTDYKPSCLSDCGNALFCRSRMTRAGSPCLLGTGSARLLPGVRSLGRADELSRGAVPREEEADAAELLARAGRLHDSASAPLAGGCS